MKKKVFGIFACLLVVAMLTMSLTVVFATKPGIGVSGKFYRTGTEFDFQKVLPHGLHMSGTAYYEYIGSFAGDAEGDFAWNIHLEGGPKKGEVVPSITLSGRCFHTINVLAFNGDETKAGTIIILISNANQQWRVISGTGFFENVHGSGTVTPDYATDDTTDNFYSGTIYFD